MSDKEPCADSEIVKLLREQNALLKQQVATANAASHRNYMRDVAKAWEQANPIAKHFFINPYGQWK